MVNHLLTIRKIYSVVMSRKKHRLVGLNLVTGHLLYVIIWIPKAFSIPSHHSRVVITISNGFSLGGDYNLHVFTMFHLNLLSNKNIYIDSDSSTSNSQVYHCFEKKDY